MRPNCTARSAVAEVTTVIRGEDKTAAAYRTAERRADAHSRKLQGLSGAERKRYNAVGREYKKVQGEMKREDAARRASLQQTGLAFGAMALVGVAALGKVAVAGIAFNRQVETATIQFGSFFGSVEEAEGHVRSLTQFAASTPFQLPGILTASRSLKTFSADAVYGGETLRIIGDAAAGVSAPLEGVSLWVGRLYSGLKAGRPVGEAAARLQELGLLSGTARNKLEALAKEGGRTEEAMAVLRDEWAKHDGAMKTLSESTAGLESTFSDLTGQLAGQLTTVTGLQGGYKALLGDFNTFMGASIDATKEDGLGGFLSVLFGTRTELERAHDAIRAQTSAYKDGQLIIESVTETTREAAVVVGGPGGMAEAVKLLEINELLLFRAMDRTVDPAIRSHGGTIMDARLETKAWRDSIGGPGGLTEALGMNASMVTGTVNPAIGLMTGETNIFRKSITDTGNVLTNQFLPGPLRGLSSGINAAFTSLMSGEGGGLMGAFKSFTGAIGPAGFIAIGVNLLIKHFDKIIGVMKKMFGWVGKLFKGIGKLFGWVREAIRWWKWWRRRRRRRRFERRGRYAYWRLDPSNG